MDRRAKWIFGSGIALFVCGAGAILVPGLLGGKAVAQEQELLRKAGIPVDADDLRKLDPVERENAAAEYDRALKIWSSPQGKAVASLSGGRTGPGRRTVYDYAAIAKSYRSLPELHTALSAAAAKPKLRFNRKWEDGANVLFPEYAEFKQLTKALSFAAIGEAESGDYRKAVEYLQVARTMAAHVEGEPTIIAGLVGTACHSIVHAGIAECFRKLSSNRSALAALQTFLERQPPLADTREHLYGELVLLHYSLKEWNPPVNEWEQPSTGSIPIEERMMKYRPFRDSVHAKLLREYRAVIEDIGRKPNDANHVNAAFAASGRRMNTGNTPADRMAVGLMPLLDLYGGTRLRVIADARLMKTANCLLLSRLDKGKLPAALPEGEDSEDPFTGKPLIYKPKGDSFILYSVSQNGADDRGVRGRDQVFSWPKDLPWPRF